MRSCLVSAGLTSAGRAPGVPSAPDVGCRARVARASSRAVSRLALRRLLAVLVLPLGLGLTAGCEELRLQVRPPAADTGVAPTDAGEVAGDAGATLDAAAEDARAAALDVGAADAQAVDSGTPADVGAPDSGAPPVPCGFDVLPPADRERVVLVGEPFTAMPGVDGTTVRALVLSATGELTATNTRLDVRFRPARIGFVPSGQYALVLGEDGALASVRVTSASQLSVVSTVQLPSAGYGDLRILADGQTAVVVGSNVDATSGLSTVTLACDGTLSVDTAAFYNLRLTSSLAWIDAAQTRAVVLGGQAVFAPVDANDLRIFSRAAGRWTEVAAFDLWRDAVDALRIAVSPDGRTLVVPNGSPFSAKGGTVMVASITGDVIGSPRRLPNMGDAREALYSVDGATVLVSLLESGALAVLTDRGQGLVEVARVRGIGLAEQLVQVERGTLTGLVLAPSVDPNGGPNVARVRIEGPGSARSLGQTELGSGSEVIPGPIGLQP